MSTSTKLEGGTTPSGLITMSDAEDEEMQEAGPSKRSAPQIRQDRLYVGNLHSSVDEYTLIKAFERFGKITSLDFLFHKAGPQKGKPRGYAFIEYSNKDEALKAMITMHDKLVRGRNLVVTFAHQAPPVDDPGRLGKRKTDTGRPTALSLMKNKGKLKTNDKIAALERKLAQMQKDSPTSPSPASLFPPSSESLPTPPNHPLPPKPPAASPAPVTPSAANSNPPIGNIRRLKDEPPDLKTLIEMHKKDKQRTERLGHRPVG
ncbi:RNA-binding domain-containing protein [Calocera viscosa TUFC12733]|uniref:Probable RNA-binding protein 18 n=1 Tax=Calocera viscosa (strain TUFC12733) TaxID=1330018 RepID=A0A167K862_CALVF|nr:RNA-binding domain-containing protein [Calocera viscosa TUFC12733]